MNIEVITDDYGSMGRVIGSELHIVVESQRIEHPYSNESNGKELEKSLTKKAEKLKKDIEFAMKLVKVVKKRIIDGNALCKDLFDSGVIQPSMESEIEALESMIDEANSYIMKDVTES